MALNIPMPELPGSGFLKGIDTGSSMFSRMIQPILEREKQTQLERHFQEQLKLSKAAAARAGANSDLRRALLEQQLLAAQHSNDPMYEFNQFKNLMGMMGGGGQGGGQLPQAPMQEMGEGMGMFSPEGLSQIQSQAPEAAPDAGMGMDFSALKNNPMLRGFFKKKFGFDPLAQTDDDKRLQKMQDQMALINYRNQIKNTADLTKPTSKTISANQSVVTAANNIIPQIESLAKMDIPGQLVNMSPNLQRSYVAKANAIADGLMAAFGWPKTNEALEMAKEMVKKGTFETNSNYVKRLEGLVEEIKQRRTQAEGVLKSSKVESAADTNASNMLTYDPTSGGFY